MAAQLPEARVDLAALPPVVAVPGLNRWLGVTDFEQSLDAGLTESFDEFCTRISRTEAADA